MFNLSDKDLDRLSQEAAQQHEPGDIVGARFWDKLETRLDRDLGKVNPNPARGVRRLPYYFAPAVLVILGVTYYLVRPNNSSRKGTSSGSPPLTMVKPAPAEPLKPSSSSQNLVPSNKTNSTPTAASNTVHYPASAGAGAVPAGSASPDAAASAPQNAAASPPRNSAASAHPNPNLPARSASNSETSFGGRHHHHKLTGSNQDNTDGTTNTTNGDANITTRSSANATRSTPGATAPGSTTPGATAPGATIPGSAAANSAPQHNTRDLTYSAVRGPVVLTRRPFVDDKALTSFDPKDIRRPIHKEALHINRSLVLGIIGGPDFSSVSAIAPDRPGSNIGITADYQLFNHFYVGSGLILSRKNFAATPQSYHVPSDYYRQNLMGMSGGDVDYIKGTFSMLEIPLNLRYDFTTSGSTLVFISAGASSYFFTQQNCGYYYNLYNTRNIVDKHISYADHPDDLFASLDLSIGAEVGLSNSLSFLVAPYWKIPTRSLGFGQVQLTSVGINFALRLAPVISRKRR